MGSKVPAQLFNLRHNMPDGRQGDLVDFARKIKGLKGPLLGIDVGTKHIGVAISDSGRHVAFSKFGFRRGGIRDDIRILERVVRREKVCGAIVGMPVAPFGKSCGELAGFVEAYSCTVVAGAGVRDIGLWDESFSSVEAKDLFMGTAGKRRRNDVWGRKRAVDAGAAAVILQEALEAFGVVEEVGDV